MTHPAVPEVSGVCRRMLSSPSCKHAKAGQFLSVSISVHIVFEG